MTDVIDTPEGDDEPRAKVPAAVRAAREEMSGLREVRRLTTGGMELREVPNGHGGSDLVCTGYASVTCQSRDDNANAYEMEDLLGAYTESTVRGFAQKTISEGCDTVFWPNHGDGALPMARTKAATLRLSEDLTGLHYEARLNPARSDVQILRAAIEDGTITESSFAFRVMRQEWNEDYTQRWITEVSLDRGDVSPVTFGANPRTGDYPLSMRSAMTILSARGITWRAFAGSLKDVRAGATLSQATIDVLQPILDDLAAIDKLVDADQPSLAELLGVANPDDDGEVEQDSAAPPAEKASAPVIPLFLPDYGAEARLKLAAARGR